MSSVNNPYECRESGPPAARSSTGDHSYNLTDPAAMSDSSLYLGEASQVLDFEVNCSSSRHGYFADPTFTGCAESVLHC